MAIITTGVEWIDHYHQCCDTPQNCDNLPTLGYSGKHALDFQNNMTAYGCKASYAWGDDNAWESDFKDWAFGGDSFQWSESVDFCYFAGHGGMLVDDKNSILGKCISFTVTHAYCNGWSNTWKLGIMGNLKWLVLHCCKTVLGTDSASVWNVWGGPMQGIHLVCGFVQDSTDCWWSRNVGGDFGNEAGSGQTLASSWVDQACSFWLNDESVAIAAGSTQEQAIWLRDNERIWAQGSPVASTNWLAWMWRG